MFTLGSCHTYQFYIKPCDMRKGFDSLVGLIKNELSRDPLSGEVYVFVNRTRSFIKLLHWENGGFVLYYKRLEEGTFTLPGKEGTSRAISWPELVLMVEGIEVKNYIQKRRYKVEK